MMQRCKEDCYWYDEWQDMNAHILYCKCKNADSIEPEDCENCEQYHSKYKPTNADRIRAMTDEELADYLRWHNDLYSRNGLDWLDWLRKEIESEGE